MGREAGSLGRESGARGPCEEVLRRQSSREPAARTYARSLPIVPVRARGLTIEGADGRRYLDCLSGAGALALGHNHPVVLEAVRKVLDSGAPLNALDLATPVKDAFLTELFRTLPPGLAGRARVRFCGPTGSDAVETAYGLVRAATGRTGIITFAGAGHGRITRSPDTSSHVCDAEAAFDAKATCPPRSPDFRCPFGVSGEQGTEPATRWTESVLDAATSGVPLPAGLIVEPVQGEGGVIPAPDGWLRRMRHLTAARSVPLIADEIQTGVGRTGTFWAVEHSDVTPDVMVLSEAIGGSLPLALVVYRDDLHTGGPSPQTGPFRGNQLAMAAGTATLAHVRENRLAERAAALGARMLGQLKRLAAEFPCVGEARGRGLMIGVELVDPDGDEPAAEPETEPCPTGTGLTPGSAWDGEAAPPVVPDSVRGRGSAGRLRPGARALASAVQRECLRRGLIVGLGGRHGSVVRLLPPLTITDEQATAVLDRLADAVRAVAAGCPGGTAVVRSAR
ncbi:aminotransferase class III-fold pyridoxal phosphate-dependent enzyme [Streptomyces sp. NPDC006624]|uniref:aminotransferase class III-fold pyridoxal phosphate-dependent enzyme n=1 Tax=Streptomyces sp. NPDC006624 TaxID=3154892 RepID=UPI0033A9D29F